ncbi:MAG: hypothetical protein R3F04_00225 [Lysobacteraceae bacterium]
MRLAISPDKSWIPACAGMTPEVYGVRGDERSVDGGLAQRWMCTPFDSGQDRSVVFRRTWWQRTEVSEMRRFAGCLACGADHARQAGFIVIIGGSLAKIGVFR